MKRIPTRNDPFYTQKTPLDGTSYQLTFRWNHRTGTWSLDLAQADGTPVITGVRIMVGVPLLMKSHYLDSCPPGEIICTTRTLDDSPPRLNDLADGARCALLYIPLLDLTAYAQGNFADSDNG